MVRFGRNVQCLFLGSALAAVMAAILGAQASARPIAANNDESGRSLNAAAK